MPSGKSARLNSPENSDGGSVLSLGVDTAERDQLALVGEQEYVIDES